MKNKILVIFLLLAFVILLLISNKAKRKVHKITDRRHYYSIPLKERKSRIHEIFATSDENKIIDEGSIFKYLQFMVILFITKKVKYTNNGIIRKMQSSALYSI